MQLIDIAVTSASVHKSPDRDTILQHVNHDVPKDGVLIRALVDTGASHSYINQAASAQPAVSLQDCLSGAKQLANCRQWLVSGVNQQLCLAIRLQTYPCVLVMFTDGCMDVHLV